jgi:hypothetical protein
MDGKRGVARGGGCRLPGMFGIGGAEKEFIMSAESEQLNEQITQSVALLRRHL